MSVSADPPARLLAIESATDWLGVAFFEHDDCVAERVAPGTRQHASALMPMIADGLGALGWDVDAIGALGVSIGPGSFTSLRIGLATAKGLSFGRDWTGVGVSTLEAMADGEAGEGDAVVLAMLDARRGEWYAGAWTGRGAARRAILPEGLYVPETLVADLGAAAERLVIVCPEAATWRSALADAGLVPARVVEGDAARPSAARVGRLACEALARGEGQPVEALSARYLRRAEAEATRLASPVEPGAIARVDPRAS